MESSKIEHLEKLDMDSFVQLFPGIFDSFSETADGKYVFINNLSEDYSIWSREAVEYFGLPSMEMYGAGDIWLEHIAPEDRGKYIEEIKDLFTGKKYTHDIFYRARNKEGEYVSCSCRGRVICDSQGEIKYFVGTIINHEKEDAVDPVTGLYSHQSLLRYMDRFSQQNEAYVLCFLGIQRFANLNATYGFEMGNRILKELSNHMMVNKENCRVFRLEGTKFAILSHVEDTNREQMKEKFSHIRDYCKNQIVIDGNRVSADICGSYIEVDHPKTDINTVYNSVLYALDVAKKGNMQNLISVDQEFLSTNKNQLELLASIRNSIVPKVKGFFLTYQPIVDSNTEKIMGAEALLRWKDENGIVIPPDVYIDWLEQDPLFYDLGKWILKTAMTDMLPVVKQQPDFTININLAYPQLQRENFNEDVVRIINEVGFPPENLKLELTERCRVLDKEQLRNRVAFFKSLGIHTALDDFGTGYSALTLMVSLPVAQIKIDKDYVKDIVSNKEKQILIRAVTSCANDLEKQICVEGIEEKDTADFIRKNYKTTYF
nr:EAL domain-containing protein [Lachnospiraceae bacterium]